MHRNLFCFSTEIMSSNAAFYGIALFWCCYQDWFCPILRYPAFLPYQVAKMVEVVCETISSSFDHLACNFIDSRNLVVLHSFYCLFYFFLQYVITCVLLAVARSTLVPSSILPLYHCRLPSYTAHCNTLLLVVMIVNWCAAGVHQLCQEAAGDCTWRR